MKVDAVGGSYADASDQRKRASDALKGFRQEHDDPTGRLALADRVLAASDAPNTFPFPEVRDASLLGIGAQYETEDGQSVTLDPRKLILLYRHGTAPDVELKPAQLEAAANAVRRELGNAKVLSECSERRMAEVCRDVVRAVLDATAFHPSR